jgi:hypothetical protein
MPHIARAAAASRPNISRAAEVSLRWTVMAKWLDASCAGFRSSHSDTMSSTSVSENILFLRAWMATLRPPTRTSAAIAARRNSATSDAATWGVEVSTVTE